MIECFKNVPKATVQSHRGRANFTEQWAVFQFQSYSYNTSETTASASGPHSSSNSFQTFSLHLDQTHPISISWSRSMLLKTGSLTQLRELAVVRWKCCGRDALVLCAMLGFQEFSGSAALEEGEAAYCCSHVDRVAKFALSIPPLPHWEVSWRSRTLTDVRNQSGADAQRVRRQKKESCVTCTTALNQTSKTRRWLQSLNQR